MGNKVVYISGLSGSGKTTLATDVAAMLPGCVFLDGDVLRRTVNSDLGFSRKDKIENIKRNNALIKRLYSQGRDIVCAFVAGIAEERDKLFKEIPGVIQIQLSTPLDVCSARDTKGHYTKNPDTLAGVGTEYTPLPDPAVILDTSKLTEEKCVDLIRPLVA